MGLWNRGGNSGAQCAVQPFEIEPAAGFDGKDEEFGDVIGMELMERGVEGGQLFYRGLDEEQDFCGGFDGSSGRRR